MRSPEAGADPEVVAGQVNERLKWFVFMLVILTHLLLVLSIWGEWGRVGIVTGAFVVVTGLNMVLAQRFFSERTRMAEALRVALNLLATIIYGHFSDWAFPVWIYLPLNSLWVDSSVDRWAPMRLYVLLALVVGAAMLDGCPPAIPLTFLVLSVLIASISDARVQLTQLALRSLAQRNQELTRALSELEERTRELKQAQARLVDTAREVGMSEVATNVLHSVGNVLNSAVIGLETMYRAVGSSRVGRLKQATALLQEHREQLADFLAPGARGNHLPDYLSAVADELMGEQTRLLEDMDAMGRHIEHIRAIVQVQQNYARTALMPEECDLAQLIDDALRIQLAALQRHGVSIRRNLSPVPRLKVDKHKVLQILVNLISNAKDALDAVPEGSRNLSVRLTAQGKLACIQVMDDGRGIAPEIRERLFVHGFTTRKDGHGFGLHTSALAAQLLGGRLMLESEGLGKGAVATLELPLP